MKLRETCGCGASIEVEDRYAPNITAAIEKWRSNHKHVLCRPGSTESDEHASSGPVIPERDQRSSTDLRLDFGFVPDVERPVEAM